MWVGVRSSSEELRNSQLGVYNLRLVKALLYEVHHFTGAQV
jgi:hypothetical protein